MPSLLASSPRGPASNLIQPDVKHAAAAILSETAEGEHERLLNHVIRFVPIGCIGQNPTVDPRPHAIDEQRKCALISTSRLFYQGIDG